jgi:hypothetical protein
VRSPTITPLPTDRRLRSEALRCRFLQPISNMFYGLMPTAVARQYFPRRYFDWGDAFMIAAISARYDVEIASEELFGAGIKTAVRNPTAANGVYISASTYRRKCIGLAFKTLLPHHAAELAVLVWRESKRMDEATVLAETQYREAMQAGRHASTMSTAAAIWTDGADASGSTPPG